MLLNQRKKTAMQHHWRISRDLSKPRDTFITWHLIKWHHVNVFWCFQKAAKCPKIIKLFKLMSKRKPIGHVIFHYHVVSYVKIYIFIPHILEFLMIDIGMKPFAAIKYRLVSMKNRLLIQIESNVQAMCSICRKLL